MVDSKGIRRTDIFILISRSPRPSFREHNILTNDEINSALDEVAHETCIFRGAPILSSTNIHPGHGEQYRLVEF